MSRDRSESRFVLPLSDVRVFSSPEEPAEIIRKRQAEIAKELESDEAKRSKAIGNTKGYFHYLRQGQSIENTIRLLPKYRGTIYRGLFVEDESLHDITGTLNKVGIRAGVTIADMALTSYTCNGDPRTNPYFRDNDFILCRVKKNLSGVAIEKISMHPDEQEILVSSEVTYQVVEIFDRNVLKPDYFHYWGKPNEKFIIDLRENVSLPRNEAGDLKGRSSDEGWFQHIKKLIGLS